MASTVRESRVAPVAVAETDRLAADEWGLYDPERAGFAALVEVVESRGRANGPGDAVEAYSMRAANRLKKIAQDKKTDK